MNYFWGCLGLLIVIGLAIAYWPILVALLVILIAFYLIKAFIGSNNVANNNVTKRKTIDASERDVKAEEASKEYVHRESAIESESFKGPLLECGLYYGEIILLDWLNGSKQSAKVPSSIASFYSVNPLKSTYEFLEKGLIKNGPVSTGLKSLKVTQLKDILKENNAKVSGKKAELIERIIKNEYFENTDVEIPKTYVVSSDGQQILDTYGIFPWAKRQKGLLTPIDYVPYSKAKSPYELTKIKICKEWIDSITTSNGVDHPYSFLTTLESEIANCLSTLNDNNAIKHYIYSSALDYFSFAAISGVGPAFNTPKEWDSSYLQGEAIKYFQKYPIDTSKIGSIVNDFTNDYGKSIPPFLLSGTNDLVGIITDAISMDPPEYHQKRLSFIEKNIPENMLWT